MYNSQSLCQRYGDSLQGQGRQKSPKILSQFKNLLSGLCNTENNEALPLKYGSDHVNFLLQVLSEGVSPESIKFSLLIKVVNLLLKGNGKFQVILPNNLIESLARVLGGSSDYLRSPTIISNVIWLVGRCIQLCRQRVALLQRVRESRLLECCLACPRLQPTAEKGISLIVAYMTKLELVSKQFALILLPNLHKFKSQESIRQILTVLSKIGLDAINSSQEQSSNLTNFLICYIQNQSISWESKLYNWELFVAAAHRQKTKIGELQIARILASKLSEEELEVEDELLNQVQEVASILMEKNRQAFLLLGEASKTLMSNPISRRIFIQNHERMNLQIFVGILSSSTPTKLIEHLRGDGEKQNILKLMICLKRSSSLLGLDVFFYHKFPRSLCTEVLEVSRSISSSKELMEIWLEVTREKNHSTHLSD